MRARVSGILENAIIRKAARVKAGQSLFTIDPAPSRPPWPAQRPTSRPARPVQRPGGAGCRPPATPAGEQSDQPEGVRRCHFGRRHCRRGSESGAGPLREARLNLAWTRVESPISGIASRALKSEGSLVSGPDVLLTTVSQTDPVQVLFGVADNERLRLRQEADAGRISWPADGRFQVSLKLADGSEYGRTGTTDFSDVRISRETGTSEMRAELPNPEGLLKPGQFVRVRLSGAVRTGSFQFPSGLSSKGPRKIRSRGRKRRQGGDEACANRRMDRRRCGGDRRPDGRRSSDRRRRPQARPRCPGPGGLPAKEATPESAPAAQKQGG